MFSNNPYAQAGWHNPQNPLSVNVPAGSSSSQSSVYGALPSHNHFNVPRDVAIGAGSLKFHLHSPTSGYPTILSSTLITSMNVHYLEVVTDKDVTYIRNLSGNNCIAIIYWGTYPLLTIEGTQYTRYSARKWLASELDGSKTLFSPERKPYRWVCDPTKPDQFSLYSFQGNQSPIANMTRDSRSVTLNLNSSDVVKVGMMELIISTVLLQSGRFN